MNPPAEVAHLLCTACRQEIQKDSDPSEEAAPIGRFVHRSVVYVANDPECTDQLGALGRLEAENRRPGADLSTEAENIAHHPELREWLKKSDRIADPKVMKGRADLTRQRRLGVLRSLESEDQGFPIHQPVPQHRLPPDQGFWLLRLRDELEWLVMPVFKKTISRPYARPTKDRLNHREARAILDWKASRLDMWLADRPHLVGGRLAVDSSRGVLFDTDAFVRWVYALMN
jgi:hypothetical protein